jgi:filamentous hemagglutinin
MNNIKTIVALLALQVFFTASALAIPRVHPHAHVNNGGDGYHQRKTITSESSTSKQDWTSTKKLTSNENIKKHFSDHSSDFPNLKTEKSYVDATKKFLNNPPTGTLTKIRANGEVVLYHPDTNTFAIATKNGTPKTMYKPDPSVHGYKNNLDYFYAQ